MPWLELLVQHPEVVFGGLVGQKTRVFCESISRFKIVPEKNAIAILNGFALSTRFLRIGVRFKILANRRGFANQKCVSFGDFCMCQMAFSDLGSRFIAYYFCDLNPAILTCVCCRSKEPTSTCRGYWYALPTPRCDGILFKIRHSDLWMM